MTQDLSDAWDLRERRVRIGESWPVSNGRGYGYLGKLPDGSVITLVENEGRRCVQRSKDGGYTWEEVGDYGERNFIWTCPLSDDTVLASGSLEEDLGKGEYVFGMWRGKDSYENIRHETCRILLPYPVYQPTDNFRRPRDEGPEAIGNIVELPDGRLLGTSCGCFPEDTVTATDPMNVSGMKAHGVAPIKQSRVFVMESEDRGLVWRYLSTVCRGSDLHPVDSEGRPVGVEGANETGMVCTREGHLVVLMRVGRITPLHQARSEDGGRTWSDARPLHTYGGVCPVMVAMGDGTVACRYWVKTDAWPGWREQRREARVMFSFDGGRSWAIDKLVYGGHAQSSGGLCEIEPGLLLCTYASIVSTDVAGRKEDVFKGLSKNFRTRGCHITVNGPWPRTDLFYRE